MGRKRGGKRKLEGGELINTCSYHHNDKKKEKGEKLPQKVNTWFG